MKRILAVLTLLLALLGAVPVRAGEPPTAPILRIETGMHTAIINRIATDAANRYLVTGSDDKTVRVWSLIDGRLLQTLRPPIGSGDEGKLYAVALSPDGQTVACGGWTGHEWDDTNSIYLFDRATGRLWPRLGGLPKVVQHLAFSPDGRLLAAALGNGGVRVYRVANGTLAAQDANYGDGSYGAGFDAAGRLVTTCLDGFVRLYDSRFQLVAKAQAPGGQQPYSVRFSPDGSRVAVGFYDSSAVNVLSGQDLRLLYAPATSGVDNGNLSSVAFSADGRFLYAGGQWQKNGKPIRRWTEGGRGAYNDLDSGANDTIFDLQPLRDGGVAFGAGDPAWGVLDEQGRRRLLQSPPTADYRNGSDKLRLATDSAAVQFAYRVFGAVPARFDMAARALQAVDQPNVLNLLLPPATPPRTAAPTLSVTDWDASTAPKLNGAPLQLESYEISRSLAIAPDGSRFLLGTEWLLRCFDRAGQEVWKVSVPGVAWAVNVAGNGQVGAAAFGDGTIRWYRMRDGAELLALFPHADRKRWVLWTPSGYYDASPGGEDLIGWHVNNGKDNAADFFPASKFRDTFYRPDVIAHVLETLDEAAAVRLANAASHRRPQQADTTTVLQQQPPVARWLGAEEIEASTPTLTLRFAVRAPSGEPVTRLEVRQDDLPRPVAEQAWQGTQPSASGEAQGTIQVPVPPRDCTLTLLASNRFAPSVPATLRVKWTARGVGIVPVSQPHGRLWLLAVGINAYPKGCGLNPLRYAANDAQAFAAAMLAQKGVFYEDVQPKVLVDGQATRVAILRELKWLREHTERTDTAMIFFAGHGLNKSDGYYFAPVDYQDADAEATGVGFEAIQKNARLFSGRTLFFLDTCHAANAASDKDLTGAMNALRDQNWIVFSAAQGNQAAEERQNWQHGAFTQALLDAFAGGAAAPNGEIRFLLLSATVSEAVERLTASRQTPALAAPNFSDFPLAVRVTAHAAG